MEREELQRKIEVYRTLEERTEGLMKQREAIMNKIVELRTTAASLDDIEKSDGDILFPLGSEAWSHGKISNKDSIMVEIGAGIVLEKSLSEAKEIIGRRVKELEDAVDEIGQEVAVNSEKLKQWSPEIESEINKMNAG